MMSTSPPERFICPLTMEVMENPVKHIETGVIYEKEAIMHWLYFGGNATCPLTRLPLHPSELHLDVALMESIKEWKTKNCPEMNDEEDENDDDYFDEVVALYGSIVSQTQRSPVKSTASNSKRTRSIKSESSKQCQPDESSVSNNNLADLRSKILKRRDERLQAKLAVSREQK